MQSHAAALRRISRIAKQKFSYPRNSDQEGITKRKSYQNSTIALIGLRSEEDNSYAIRSLFLFIYPPKEVTKCFFPLLEPCIAKTA